MRLYIKMKQEAVIFLLIGLCIASVGATLNAKPSVHVMDVMHHIRSAAQSPRNDDCDQDYLNDFANSYPTKCREGLDNLNISALSEFDPDTLNAFGELFCQPKCGNPLIEFYELCVDEELATVFIQLCAEASSGDKCYHALGDLTGSCNDQNRTSTCTSQCRADVINADCCVNSLDILTAGVFNVSELYGELCNVTLPTSLCEGSSLGAGCILHPATAMLWIVLVAVLLLL